MLELFIAVEKNINIGYRAGGSYDYEFLSAHDQVSR